MNIALGHSSKSSKLLSDIVLGALNSLWALIQEWHGKDGAAEHKPSFGSFSHILSCVLKYIYYHWQENDSTKMQSSWKLNTALTQSHCLH